MSALRLPAPPARSSSARTAASSVSGSTGLVRYWSAPVRMPGRHRRVLGLGGEHHDGDVLVVLVELEQAADPVAVELGQHDVQEDEVGILGARLLERLGAVRRR